MPHTKWTAPLPAPAAQAIYDAVESDPENPKHTEQHVRDGQVLPPGQHRITPRMAFVSDGGGVSLGILNDGWSEQRAMQADGSVSFAARDGGFRDSITGIRESWIASQGYGTGGGGELTWTGTRSGWVYTAASAAESPTDAGSGLRFNRGQGQHLECVDQELFDVLQGPSWSQIFRFTMETLSVNQYLASQSSGSSLNRIYFQLGSGNNFNILRNAGSPQVILSGVGPITDTHTIGLVYDGASLLAYLNGSLANSSIVVGSLSGLIVDLLGCQTTNGANRTDFFDAVIHERIVGDAAVGATEMASIHDNLSAEYPPETLVVGGFVGAGQSNMENLGKGQYERELDGGQLNPSDSVDWPALLSNTAVSASALSTWEKGGGNYGRLVQILSKISSGDVVIFWQQGEADAQDAALSSTYAARWDAMHDDLESEPVAAGLSIYWVISALHDELTTASPYDPAAVVEVRAAIADTPNRHTNVALIDFNDLSLSVDDVHYQSADSPLRRARFENAAAVVAL